MGGFEPPRFFNHHPDVFKIIGWNRTNNLPFLLQVCYQLHYHYVYVGFGPTSPSLSPSELPITPIHHFVIIEWCVYQFHHIDILWPVEGSNLTFEVFLPHSQVYYNVCTNVSRHGSYYFSVGFSVTYRCMIFPYFNNLTDIVVQVGGFEPMREFRTSQTKGN
jgi:hypothetical protein